MKRLSANTKKGLLTVALYLAAIIVYVFILYPIRLYRQTAGDYVVMRLNAESNPYGSETDYFYYSSRTIYRYSFETGEITAYHTEIPEGEYIEEDLVVIDDWVYYISSLDMIRRINYKTMEDEEVLSVEDSPKMCSKNEVSAYDRVRLKGYKDYLILLLEAGINDYIYVCPANGNMKTDYIDVNTLFQVENRTGEEEEIVYEGICIRRYYDAKVGDYIITGVREEASGRTIFEFSGTKEIKVNGKMVSLWYKKSGEGYFYSVEEDSEDYKIDDCLTEYALLPTRVQRNKLMAEDGEIIGLLHVARNARCDPYDPEQTDLKYDVLFKLDPETGESSILYNTGNKRTRIIGYRDGTIYLLQNHKVYAQTIEGGNKTLLFKLPNNRYYGFDWQGDYLVVLYKSGVFSYHIRTEEEG